MADLLYDLENTSKAALQSKAIYAGDVYQGQPAVVVTGSEINIFGDKDNAIHVDPDFGILLAGNTVSLSVMPDNLSIGGGYWRFNPLLISCVPSTTPTPIPTLVKSTPDLVKHKKSVSDAHSYLMSNSDMAGN